MTINQLSIFLENKKGTLLQVFEILKKANIQLIATTIADTVEYGILRIICSDPALAFQELKDNGVAVALSDVFAIELDNKVGYAADAIRIFADEGIGITYLYSFIVAGKGILIFRTDNPAHAREIILQNKMNYIAEKDLPTLQ